MGGGRTFDGGTRGVGGNWGCPTCSAGRTSFRAEGIVLLACSSSSWDWLFLTTDPSDGAPHSGVMCIWLSR